MAIENIYDKKKPDGKPDTGDEDAGAKRVGGSASIEEVEGKVLLIGVDGFDTTGTMASYLRLGAAPSSTIAGQGTAPRNTGEDLASLVQGFTDDTRVRSGGEGGLAGDICPPETLATPPNVPPPPGTPATPLDVEARRRESRKLHTKGGWRDHSDGNRITTTRGDKVEVIRGNYKMVVLGRSDGWDNAAGVEIAGGNVNTSSEDLAWGRDHDAPEGQPPDASRPVALQTTYEWNQDLDGRWGWKQTTITGDPNQPDDGAGNGRIITKTWVDYMDTEVGSAERPVTKIVANTWAGDISQITYATNSVQETHASYIDSRSAATNKVSNTTTGPFVTSFTEAALQETVQVVGANFIVNMLGASLEMDMAGAIATIQMAGVIVQELIGVCIDNHAFTHMDNHPGVHVDHHSGMHFDIHDGFHTTIDTNDPVKVEPNGSIILADKSTVTIKGYDIQANKSHLSAVQLQAVVVAQHHMVL